MAVRLLVFFGMIASGKSTLATRFAQKHDWCDLNTDRVRKELAGLQATTRATAAHRQGIYTREFTARTYAAMHERAQDALEQGRCGVVLDGSYGRRQDRAQVRELAKRCGVGCLFVYCHCSEAVVRQRLAQRLEDPRAVSDGNWDIYQQQRSHFQLPQEIPLTELLVLDTQEDVAQLLMALEERLQSLRG